MATNDLKNETNRRGFLGSIATGAAALGMAGFINPLSAGAEQKFKLNPEDPDAWFNKINGKHRVVYDSTEPKGVMPFAWAKVFLMTNAATGTPENECSVVLVLRHDAIPYAFKDEMWKKYKFSEVFANSGDMGPMFQAADAATAAKTRNPMLNAKPGDFKAPGFGTMPISIPELQESGVMFCVCNAAMTVFSSVVAMQTGGKAEDILKEWTENVIPGFHIVPSGVWAVGRAQEKKCAYIYAG